MISIICPSVHSNFANLETIKVIHIYPPIKNSSSSQTLREILYYPFNNSSYTIHKKTISIRKKLLLVYVKVFLHRTKRMQYELVDAHCSLPKRSWTSKEAISMEITIIIQVCGKRNKNKLSKYSKVTYKK